MFSFMKSILSKMDADYGDIRYEVKRETVITFNGKELTQIGSNSTDGYVLRALKNGGLSSMAFTRQKDAERALRTVEENALLISHHIREPVRLAKAEVLQDTFHPSLEEDPRHVSMDEKLELTRRYNNLPLNHEGIATTITGYSEQIREKYFVNTEGAEIREDLVTTRLSCSITSKDGTLIQNVRLGLGGSQGFANLRNQEAEFEKKTSLCLDLLKAEPVEGQKVNVILNPSLAGVFTHEAFGHFSEADLIEDAPTLRVKMKIGERLGHEALNIIDDPTLPGQLGFYKYDDEGVRVRSDTAYGEGGSHRQAPFETNRSGLWRTSERSLCRRGSSVCSDHPHGEYLYRTRNGLLQRPAGKAGGWPVPPRFDGRGDERRKFYLRSPVWV